MLQGINTSNDDFNDTNAELDWQTIIPQTKLYAHREHLFISEIKAEKLQQFTHVKLSIYPDGGISRMRVFGKPSLNH